MATSLCVIEGNDLAQSRFPEVNNINIYHFCKTLLVYLINITIIYFLITTDLMEHWLLRIRDSHHEGFLVGLKSFKHRSANNFLRNLSPYSSFTFLPITMSGESKLVIVRKSFWVSTTTSVLRYPSDPKSGYKYT